MLLTRQLWRSRIDVRNLLPLTDRTRVDAMTERSLGANARHRVSGTTHGAEGARIAENATGGRGTTRVSAAAASAEVTDKS